MSTVGRGNTTEPITCLHVLAGERIAAHKAVYAQNGESPDYIPKVFTQWQHGLVFAGISDLQIESGEHGTIIVAGIVLLYSDEPSDKQIHSAVTLHNFDGACEDADRMIGVTVSLAARGIIRDGRYCHGIKVMLCPWMSACTSIDVTKAGWCTRGPRPILTNDQANNLVTALGWTKADGKPDVDALDHLGRQIADARDGERATAVPCFIQ